MVNQVVFFDVTTLLNVTAFLPTAFWITATDQILRLFRQESQTPLFKTQFVSR